MRGSLFNGREANHAVFITGVLILAFAALPPTSAQDGFAGQGFGFGSEAETDAVFGGIGGAASAVHIGGEIEASALGFFDDFDDGADAVRLGGIFSGKLNFSAETSRAGGVINLKLAPGLVYYDKRSPVFIDEAYLTAYFGKFDLEAGLRKLTWGKADSLGPLDVINPQDYSDLSNIGDARNLKIARPLVHASLRLGTFSKLESVFIPNFTPLRFADTGRWAPGQFAALSSMTVNKPDTESLDYFQAGARYTTTLGGAADIGVQYYYGRLTNQAVTVLSGTPPIATFAYNPYHQIGVDYAQVLGGFNIRAEAAANITGDLDGDDAGVYNPSLAWSLGFDRQLFWGINLNAQCNETIRLFDRAIKEPQDLEYNTDITSTRITAALSKNFLRDELAIRFAALWEIESGACLILPALAWMKDDIGVELSCGIFAGSDAGLFGQFHDNSFVKAGIKYTF
jgi:hypothetical protein